jgi:hypothetical protein
MGTRMRKTHNTMKNKQQYKKSIVWITIDGNPKKFIKITKL